MKSIMNDDIDAERYFFVKLDLMCFFEKVF